MSNRRIFLMQSAAAFGTLAAGKSRAQETSKRVRSKNERPVFGLIGAGYQQDTRRVGRGIAIGKQAAALGDVAMICEIDSVAAEHAAAKVGRGRAKLVHDYREVIESSGIDAVLIATPDHWHTKIAIEAMRAGKDIYCEKPVATRIEEGKWLREAVRQTGRVFQVGTQQRSEYQSRFLQAIALVRSERIGELKRVLVGLGSGWEGGPFKDDCGAQDVGLGSLVGASTRNGIHQRTHASDVSLVVRIRRRANL